MRTTRKNTFSLACLMLWSCLTAQAQRAADVVKWSGEATCASADSCSVKLSAAIQEGWHIYALSQPTGGPIPLKISTPASSAFALASPIAEAKTVQKHFEPNFKMDTLYYLKSANFDLELKRTGPAEGDTLSVDARFQACSDRLCLPPYTAHISAGIKRK
ncbi:MAG: protein-disulfide reductase DsbD family protein [Candidatus Solibacter sp.]|nr:protein-disulfide reductase DsbD family protein [Candidatus Solibacter sp.]